jgi:hypothetical protein
MVDDDEPAPRLTPLGPPPCAADLKLIRQAVSEQGKALAGLAAQVARLTRRQDDQDARHSEIEERLAVELARLAQASQTHAMRVDRRLDELFLALTKALPQSQ